MDQQHVPLSSLDVRPSNYVLVHLKPSQQHHCKYMLEKCHDGWDEFKLGLIIGLVCKAIIQITQLCDFLKTRLAKREKGNKMFPMDGVTEISRNTCPSLLLCVPKKGKFPPQSIESIWMAIILHSSTWCSQVRWVGWSSFFKFYV